MKMSSVRKEPSDESVGGSGSGTHGKKSKINNSEVEEEGQGSLDRGIAVEMEKDMCDGNGGGEEGGKLSESKRKKPRVGIEENKWFGESLERSEELKSVWDTSDWVDDETLQIFQHPFRHGQIKDFVKNKKFIDEFLKLFDELEFQEKSSDLFQFRQSFDLNSIVDPKVYSISEYLNDKVLPFMKKLTGLPLNQTIDLFLSVYAQTDVLLCHDDELDSRRIAFIWYLSEDWSEDYGGTLDLFSATDTLQPDKIVKKIVPDFNKFVFFEVGATSYHQVSEVLTEGKNRLALSGWFYGDRLPRPKIEFPILDIPHNVLETFQDFKGILKSVCQEDWLEPKMHTLLNDKLCEDSQLLIPGFLSPTAYKRLCESIVEMDVSDSSFFKHRGPANLEKFSEAIPGPSNRIPADDNSNNDINVEFLRDMFHSKEFLQFLESVTEFPFMTLKTTQVISSLHKYSNGSYTLLKSSLKQQKSSINEEVEESGDDEDEPNFVDVLLYFSHKWDSEWGGDEVFCPNEEGEGSQQQLMSITPEGNALAMAVRSRDVISFTKYVNCLAKDNVYFVYKMKFSFNGNFE